MTGDQIGWLAAVLGVGLGLGLALGALLWLGALARARAELAGLAARLGELDGVRGEAEQARAALAARDAELAAERARGEALPGLRAALDSAQQELKEKAEALSALEAQQAERDRAHEEQRAALLATGEALKTEFERLAQQALKGTQGQFLELAEAAVKRQREAAQAELEANKAALSGLLQPVAETLGRYQEGLKAIEEKREQAYGSLAQQLQAVAVAQGQVQAEAGRLATALRSSTRVAGSWGESQLRNVLELAGLREGIDFTLQASAEGEERRRPDAVLRLPGGRELIVDAKCSLSDYLEAAGADDLTRRAALNRHVACVKAHAQGLAQKAYWTQFGKSADFVVMFLPGENYLSAALEQDMGLLDWAFSNRILLAGPINLLAIAKTVALVWRQETLAQEAREIGKLGADLYAGLATMGEHVAGLGKNLRQAVAGYNEFVGSLERNVFPKARRLTELGVEQGKKPVPELALVEAEVRGAAAPELLSGPRAEAAE